MVKLTLIQGDCLKVMKKIPDESVDLVVTDPPYFIIKENTVVDEKAKKWDFFNNEKEYLKFNIEWLNMCYNLMKFNSSVLVFWSEKHLWLFNKILKNTKFRLYKIIIWHYPNILKGFSNKRWFNTFDFIFHLIKGEKPETFNASFVKEENKDVWIFPKPQSNFKKDRKYHPTQKPLELFMRIVKMFSNENDTILDPFLGSGTTLLACLGLRRNCIGIEINSKYIEIIKKRLNWGSSLGDVEFKFFKENEFKGVI